jgi:hypothetical protein
MRKERPIWQVRAYKWSVTPVVAVAPHNYSDTSAYFRCKGYVFYSY